MEENAAKDDFMIIHVIKYREKKKRRFILVFVPFLFGMSVLFLSAYKKTTDMSVLAPLLNNHHYNVEEILKRKHAKFIQILNRSLGNSLHICWMLIRNHVNVLKIHTQLVVCQTTFNMESSNDIIWIIAKMHKGLDDISSTYVFNIYLRLKLSKTI